MTDPIAPPGAVIADDAESPHLLSVQIDQAFEADLDADELHRLALYVLAAEGAAPSSSAVNEMTSVG